MIRTARLKLVRNQANAKQHPELNFFYLKIVYILHQGYYPKMKVHILKNKEKNKCVCINEIIRLIIMKMKMKTKKRLHGYDYCLRYTLIQLYHTSNFTRDNEMSRVNTFLSNTFISNARLKFAKYQAHHREAKLFLYESLLN